MPVKVRAVAVHFKNFNVNLISKFTNDDIERLMKNKSIIRNQLKVKSTISNANAFIEVQKEFHSFDNYIWSFTNNKTIINNFNKLNEVPAETVLSNKISKGKGVRIQKYKDTELLFLDTFKYNDGLKIQDSAGRIRTFDNIDDWIGKRAQAGRLVPKGFPKLN